MQHVHIPKNVVTPTIGNREDGIFKDVITEFPKHISSEKIETYVMGVKENCPKQGFDIPAGGFVFSFRDKIFPKEASYVGNETKHYPAGFPMLALTEKQAKKLKEICDESYEKIPTRQNHKFDGKNDEPEFLNSETICVGDWIVLEKLTDYNYIARSVEIEEPELLIDNNEGARNIYEAQGKGKKIRK